MTSQNEVQQGSDRPPVKALLFDIGGTVFDWHSTVKHEIEERVAARGWQVDAARFTTDWRRRMFELAAQVRQGTRPWTNSDTLHRVALDDVLAAHSGVTLSLGERDELTEVWHRLR